jgi:hypothetical protein
MWRLFGGICYTTIIPNDCQDWQLDLISMGGNESQAIR